MDVIVVGGGPWSFDINFPIHHTVRILSRRHRVLYFYRDSHASLLGRLAGRKYGNHSVRELAGLALAPPAIEQVDERLWTCRLAREAAILPLSYPPWARDIEVRLVARQLRHAVAQLGFEHPLLWFYWWFFPELVDAVPHTFAVYDIYDDHTQHDNVRSNAKRQAYTGALERRLLRKVDLALAVSQKIVRLKAGDAPVRYLPNGVDIKVAEAVRGSGAPSGAASLPRPIVGYLGQFDSRLDWPLVVAAAHARPAWTFLFVGNGYTSPVEQPPNLHIFNFDHYLPYSEALRYVESFDVALIPFVLDALTEAICPAKLYDYLALGKPVVSTPLPAINEVTGDSGLVYQAATVETFVEAIDRSLREGDSLVEDRLNLVRSMTWERRVEQAMAWVSDMAPRREAG